MPCEIVFPVCERFISDSVPPSVRYYPLYAWGLRDAAGWWRGCGGIHTGEVFDEFGSLWLDERVRGQGWARKLTEARIEFIFEREDLFPNPFIMRIGEGYSPRVAIDHGFEGTWMMDRWGYANGEVQDKEGDQIYYANKSMLKRPSEPPKITRGNFIIREDLRYDDAARRLYRSQGVGENKSL